MYKNEVSFYSHSYIYIYIYRKSTDFHIKMSVNFCAKISLRVCKFSICIFAFIISYLPNPSAGYDARSIFKRSLTGLNSEFSFSYTSCLTEAEEPSLSYHLPIAGGRIIGFIPFPRVLVLCEMQLVSSRI